MTDQNFLRVQYGSRLYGTSTPASDTDVKIIYLPAISSLLLGQKLKIYKERTDVDGKKLPDDASMPVGGTEIEYIPLQTFVRDFVRGQTYALEIAFAYLETNDTAASAAGCFITELITRFSNSDVYSMVGFAKKQTMDYCHRGERLNEAKKVLNVLEGLASNVGSKVMLRLDTPWSETETYLDEIVRKTGLKTSTSMNNNRTMRTLELNGRSYIETTTIEHLVKLLQRLIDSYGERTTAAVEADVDYKSLSHAIRVYEQAIELLNTGKIAFPRPNAKYLLGVKEGKADLEYVKKLLRGLDEEVQEKIKTSALRKRTPELEAEAEAWLLQQLQDLYHIFRDVTNPSWNTWYNNPINPA